MNFNVLISSSFLTGRFFAVSRLMKQQIFRKGHLLFEADEQVGYLPFGVLSHQWLDPLKPAEYAKWSACPSAFIWWIIVTHA